MPKTIDDKFAAVPSKSVRWTMRNVEKGLCQHCGDPRDDEFLNCTKCRLANSERKKKLYQQTKGKQTRVVHYPGSKYDHYIK